MNDCSIAEFILVKRNGLQDDRGNTDTKLITVHRVDLDVATDDDTIYSLTRQGTSFVVGGRTFVVNGSRYLLEEGIHQIWIQEIFENNLTIIDGEDLPEDVAAAVTEQRKQVEEFEQAKAEAQALAEANAAHQDDQRKKEHPFGK